MRYVAGRWSLLRDILRNIRKDLSIEARNRAMVSIALAFAGIATLSVGLVGRGLPFEPRVASLFLWIMMFFSAMNALSHTFVREEEEGTALFLRLHSPATAILLGKMIFNVLFFLILQGVIVALFLFFLEVTVVDSASFIAVVTVGGLALSTSTTFLGALVAAAGGRGTLFTVISFPLIVPILWVSTYYTERSMLQNVTIDAGGVIFLLAFSGTLVVISILLFPYIWNDT